MPDGIDCDNANGCSGRDACAAGECLDDAKCDGIIVPDAGVHRGRRPVVVQITRMPPDGKATIDAQLRVHDDGAVVSHPMVRDLSSGRSTYRVRLRLNRRGLRSLKRAEGQARDIDIVVRVRRPEGTVTRTVTRRWVR